MAMTLDEIAAVVNAAFPTAEAFANALAMLDAQMRLNVANSQQRLAQAGAAAAQQQAQTVIQQAQATALAAQQEFDAIVAQLAQG